jgi:glycerol-3-phosphate dehydrogenase
VQRVLDEGLQRAGTKRVRHVKGSHVVLPRLYVGDHAYILQNTDGRVVFLIPYEGEFTLIGTTDIPFDGDLRRVAIDADETAYLCTAASRFLRRSVRPEKVAWSYAGVRALFDDGESDPSAITRDYSLDLDAGPGRAPVLSVFGGKLTTYRPLAEHALAKLASVFPGLKGPWTARASLPGGDLPGGDRQKFLAEVEAEWPWLKPASSRRLARSYGTRVHELLAGARSLSDLGEDLGAGLSERELSFLVDTEWASSAEDVLWRRSKLGLHGGPGLEARVSGRLAGGARDPLAAAAGAR